MCIYARAHACECRFLWRPEALDYPGAGVTRGCEWPDVGAVTQTEVLGESRQCSWQLSHTPQITGFTFIDKALETALWLSSSLSF